MKKIVFISGSILLLLTSCSPLKQNVQQVESSKRYHSISPGTIWLDTDGKPIQAHGFSVFYKDGTYYWYGENKEYTVQGSNIWTYGIHCYTSKDFYNWENKGFIIPPDTTDPYSPLHPSQWIDRPHIIYCAKTKKYVAWIKILGGDDGQFMTVLQADDFLGPYKIIHKGFRPNGFESGDFDLYVDEKTSKGYIWFERPHWEMICATLTDDFTSVTEEFSVHFSGKLPPNTREAPTHFVHNGKHYLLTSGTTGFSPNQSLVSMFNDYHSEYTDLGNPHPADTSNTSYCSQITDVIKIPGKMDLYIALADMWMPQTCGTDLPKKEDDKIRVRFKSHKPRERDAKK
ncbi:MAG: family 43 glycosylhydrolase, partial [Flavisolibacter sp.]|nr:family 43 glycosylhydrolase [Flavisolibacter sp.]